jgi:hypothetical protein
MRPTLGSIGAAVILGSLLAWILLGCTDAGTPTAATQRTIDVICASDQTLQPIVVPVAVGVTSAAAPAAAPGVAAAAQLDALLVHPAVVAACAKYASKPVAVAPAASVPATVAPAVPAS